MILIAILIGLLHFVHSQYVTIWDDKMNNANGWTGYGDFNLGYSSNNCLGGTNVCARTVAWGILSGIYKSSDISLYSALQLEFSVKAHSFEGTTDGCYVWYHYDGGLYAPPDGQYSLGYKQSNEGKYYDEIIDFQKPLLSNTVIWVYLEIDANATDGTDRCYWDNVELRGILYTSSPTLTPSLNPTLYPSLYPTLYPTLYPSLYPSLTPTTPSATPTLNPSSTPSLNPTFNPSITPTLNPSLNPSITPTLNPSITPTLNPTLNPSLNPTLNPTLNPSVNPSQSPSIDGIMAIEMHTTEQKQNGLENGSIMNNDNLYNLILYILMITLIAVVGLLCICCLIYFVIKHKKRKQTVNVDKTHMEKVHSVSGCTELVTTITDSPMTVTTAGGPGPIDLTPINNDLHVLTPMGPGPIGSITSIGSGIHTSDNGHANMHGNDTNDIDMNENEDDLLYGEGYGNDANDMSDNEDDLLYGSPNVVTRGQHQTPKDKAPQIGNEDSDDNDGLYNKPNPNGITKGNIECVDEMENNNEYEQDNNVELYETPSKPVIKDM